MAADIAVEQRPHRQAMEDFQQQHRIRAPEVMQRARALIEEAAEEARTRMGAAMTWEVPPHGTAAASPQLPRAPVWRPQPAQRPQRGRHLVPRLRGTRASTQTRRTGAATCTAASAGPPSDAPRLQVNIL